MAEKVRLVVWDLDETFWHGTLSEGGITAYVDAHHEIVIELARRGIISSICSKNDLAPVKTILQERGIWDYFVFPSVDWSPKGGRVEALVETAQLRAPSVMFIDDNPGNRGEVAERVPGVQVEDETFIARMLDDPRFAGKDDRDLTRLAQYKLLEKRQGDAAQASGDNLEFLRGCDIRVVITTEIEPHLDRAIELINRTNQLNFTKKRLPEDMDEAREALRAHLKNWWIRAGLVRVIDRYGDYGFCGFYMIGGGAGGGAPNALHFCFSCRVLGMGVEQFIYQRLEKPVVKTVGEVVSDLSTPAAVDWIRLVIDAPQAIETTSKFSEIRLYGACAMDPLGHYFSMIAERVTRETNFRRGAAQVRKDCTTIMYETFVRKMTKARFDQARLADVGYRQEDFISSFLDPVSPGTWLIMGPWADVYADHYEHIATGVKVPGPFPAISCDLLTLSDEDIAAKFKSEESKEESSNEVHRIVRALREEFRFQRKLTQEEIEENTRAVFKALPDGAKLILWLPSEYNDKGGGRPSARLANATLRRVAAEFPAVRVVRMDDLVAPDQERQAQFDHFDREVYFRVFRRMLEIMESEDATEKHQEAVGSSA